LVGPSSPDDWLVTRLTIHSHDVPRQKHLPLLESITFPAWSLSVVDDILESQKIFSGSAQSGVVPQYLAATETAHPRGRRRLSAPGWSVASTRSSSILFNTKTHPPSCAYRGFEVIAGFFLFGLILRRNSRLLLAWVADSSTHWASTEEFILYQYQRLILQNSVMADQDDDFFNDLSQQATLSQSGNTGGNNSANEDESNPIPRQKRMACVVCRKRKLRCDGKKPSCGTCARVGHNCAYDEVRKKSGPKRGYVKQLEARLGTFW
jgi:Fungal Zn(2)-Cys(6) binuclear cluster domain